MHIVCWCNTQFIWGMQQIQNVTLKLDQTGSIENLAR